MQPNWKVRPRNTSNLREDGGTRAWQDAQQETPSPLLSSSPPDTCRPPPHIRSARRAKDKTVGAVSQAGMRHVSGIRSGPTRLQQQPAGRGAPRNAVPVAGPRSVQQPLASQKRGSGLRSRPAGLATRPGTQPADQPKPHPWNPTHRALCAPAHGPGALGAEWVPAAGAGAVCPQRPVDALLAARCARRQGVVAHAAGQVGALPAAGPAGAWVLDKTKGAKALLTHAARPGADLTAGAPRGGASRRGRQQGGRPCRARSSMYRGSKLKARLAHRAAATAAELPPPLPRPQ